ncbi:MAG: hypothetical protein ACREO1_14505 [Arenimonas sp.]
MRFSTIVGTFVLVFSGSVFAADAIQLDVTKENFLEQRNTIVTKINKDVDYAEISNADRGELTAALARIGEKLNQGNFSNLSDEDRKQVTLDQGMVNKALTQAKKDSRLICKKEPILGSNFDKRVCRTAAQLKRENDKMRDDGAAGRSNIK